MRGILTYHSIDPSGSAISVDAEAFRAHVRWLASGAVEVVGLRELVARDDQKGGDAVAVTFDDALESFGSMAAPLLLDAGLPVTVFVVSDRVGASNRWTGEGDHAGVPEMSVLDWDALARLAERGVEIGAHTRTHPHLTRLPVEAVAEELAGSAHRIEERIGVRPRSFAYPYGAYDHPAVEAARRCFELACTTELDLVADGSDPHRLPRLDMFYFRDPDKLTAWGTPAFERYLKVRRAGRRVRSALRTLAGRA